MSTRRFTVYCLLFFFTCFKAVVAHELTGECIECTNHDASDSSIVRSKHGQAALFHSLVLSVCLCVQRYACIHGCRPVPLPNR